MKEVNTLFAKIKAFEKREGERVRRQKTSIGLRRLVVHVFWSRGTCVLACSVPTVPDAKKHKPDDDDCVNIHVT